MSGPIASAGRSSSPETTTHLMLAKSDGLLISAIAPGPRPTAVSSEMSASGSVRQMARRVRPIVRSAMNSSVPVISVVVPR